MTKFTLNILSLLRELHTTHGLNEGTPNDYLRYRQYCARRLRRIRVSLRFKNDRNKKKYKARTVTPRVITEERFLHIPLINAERAWAYAMQLREELNDAADSPDEPALGKMRHRQLCRLRRSAQWAAQLHKLCKRRCDVRSQLESEAYAAWTRGNLALAREQHGAALEAYRFCEVLYTQLSKVSQSDVQLLIQSRLRTTVTPYVRLCAHMQSLEGGGESSTDVEGMGAVDMSMLSDKLRKVLQETRQRQASTLEHVEWWWVPPLGGENKTAALQGAVPVDRPKVRVALMDVRDLRFRLDQAQLEGKSGSGNTAGEGKDGSGSSGGGGGGGGGEQKQEDGAGEEESDVLKLYQQLLGSYDDAISLVSRVERDERALRKQTYSVRLRIAACKALTEFCQYHKLVATLARHTHMCHELIYKMSTDQAWDERVRRFARYYYGRESEKKTRPDELITMFDRCVFYVEQLSQALMKQISTLNLGKQLAARSGGGQGFDQAIVQVKDRMQGCLAARSLFMAYRCFYVAQAHRRVKNYANAYALLSRTEELAAYCGKIKADVDFASGFSVEQLAKDTVSSRAFVHAEHVLQRMAATNKLAKSLTSTTNTNTSNTADKSRLGRRYLLERVAQYAHGRTSHNFELIAFPPHFQAMPCKPIYFDLALNALELPADVAKATPVQKTSKKWLGLW